MIFLGVVLAMALIALTLVLGSRHVRDLIVAFSALLIFVSTVMVAIFHTPLVEFANNGNFAFRWLLTALPLAIWLQVIGVLWMPFAAAICHASASRSDSNPREHAVRGAAYSALFLLPWFYLVARTYEIHIPRLLMVGAYIVLYVCWLSLIWGYLTFILTESIPSYNYGMEGVQLASDTLIWLAMMAISFFAWSSSILRLHRRYRAVGHDLERAPSASVPDVAYLYPFVHLPVWLITFVVVWVITFSTAYSRTY